MTTRKIHGYAVSDFRNGKWVVTAIFTYAMPIANVKQWATNKSNITIFFSDRIKNVITGHPLPKCYWPKRF